MKKFLLSLALALAISAPAFASHEEVGTGGSNGDTFSINSFNTTSGVPVWFITCTAGTTAHCDIKPDMTFDGITLADRLAGYATTGSLASAVARVGTLEGSQFSGSYLDLTNRPTIPATFDQLTDGSTNKSFTSTEKTKLAGVATGATANSSDAVLLNRSNHTGTQTASTITGLATVATSGSYNDLSNKPSIPSATTVYNGTSALTNPVIVLKSGSTNGSGLGVFNLTADNTSGGTALCPTSVDAVNVDVNNSTAAYGTSWAVAGKVLTVTVTQPTSLLSLGLLPNVAVASGVTVNARVFCH